MAETIQRGYPYPGIDDAPAGPYAFEQLAEAVDADVEGHETRLATLEQLTPYVEYLGTIGVTSGQPWGTGPLSVVPGTNQNTAGISSPANDAVTVPPGIWSIFYRGRMNKASAATPTWGSLRDSASNDPNVFKEFDSFDIPAGKSAGSLHFVLRTTTTKTLYFRFYTETPGAENTAGPVLNTTVSVTKIGKV